MRYRNNSNYKNDTEIRKKAYVSQAVLDELKRIIEDAEVSCCCWWKRAGLLLGQHSTIITTARRSTGVVIRPVPARP